GRLRGAGAGRPAAGPGHLHGGRPGGPEGPGGRGVRPGGAEPRQGRPLRRGPEGQPSPPRARHAVTLVDDDPTLIRSTLTITGWNAVSRVTGFVRALAVGAALGATLLGNTYQSSYLGSSLPFAVPG